MKSIKNHISLIIPLFIMFFSFNVLMILDRTVKSYEKGLLEGFNMVIIASKELDLSTISKESDSIGLIKTIDVDKVLNSLNLNMKDVNTTVLKSSLPLFYQIKLKNFLTDDELKILKFNLESNQNIIKVEEFKASHDLIHQFLILVETILLVFTIFIIIISLLLIIKQISIWVYEHNQRISIMELFGAPFFMKSAILYKLMLIDSFLGALSASFLVSYLMKNYRVIEFYQKLSIEIPPFNTIEDIFIILCTALILSIIIVSITIMRNKRDIQYT